jgi:hypothetical protein
MCEIFHLGSFNYKQKRRFLNCCGISTFCDSDFLLIPRTLMQGHLLTSTLSNLYIVWIFVNNLSGGLTAGSTFHLHIVYLGIQSRNLY